ncbi:MAG TPA: beta-ketoacyl-[acyl-carrier-protein] synthase family protein [Pyrinomonadaceae bacterium]|jgi:3-oxoacyl-[acyl-carrier-protein] synthase II|nr:beta-ketoacyl-[acyl-carrier-protein] synthase family protein [Pyrinomonadaceae bacterium]
MTGERRVVITGTGALSALGATPEELWSGLLEGRSGIGRVSRLVTSGISVTTGGEVRAVPHDRLDRDREIAERAIEDALVAARCDAAECGFMWSTGLDTFQAGADGFVHRSAGLCFTDLSSRFRYPRRMIAAACASGTQAVGEAFRLIREGRAEACVAGGSSVMLTPFYLIGFAGLQAVAVDYEGDEPSAACRPFDRERRGFALADGAGALVLETLTRARQRGARVLAEVIGFGMSQDGFDLNRPCDDGAGAELCMRRALSDAGVAPGSIDAVNAHATGTFLGDLAEVAALRRLFQDDWRRIPVSGMKGAIGHAMAAAGALEAIVAAFTCATGIVPPTVNLSEPDEGCELNHVLGEPLFAGARTVLSASFGMGGQNAAIVLKRAEL